MINSKQLLNHNRQAKGFTLIEILVTTGVLAIVAGVAITIFVALTSSYDKADVITTLNHEGNRAMDQISRMIKNSNGASVVGGTILILEVPEEDANLEYSTNGNCSLTSIFSNVDNKLYKSVDISYCKGTPQCPGASPCALMSDLVEVSNLSFTVEDVIDGPDRVQVTLEIIQESDLADPEQQATQYFERTVLTRGY